jgi:phage gpG-like protein
MAAVQVITLDQLPKEIGNAIASMGKVQFKPVGKILEQLAVSDTKRRFNAGVSPEGVPWVPLRHARVSSKGADKPLRDFGLLGASVQAKATQSDLTLSSNLIYAGIHQSGGRITPKRGKFLAIPATKEAKRAGGARRFPRPLSPRINRRGSGGVLVDANEVVQYFLTKSVTIPARPFLGFSKELIGYVQEVLTDAAIRQFTFGRQPGSAPQSVPTRARAA